MRGFAKAAFRHTELGPDEIAFIRERDSFYMASTNETGWPYIQHRGGPKGFVRIIDERTVAFADLRGNRQYISLGNVKHDDRVALIFVDYPNQARLKVLARAKILPAEPPAERIFVLAIEAIDWNCPQHITPRYTLDEIEELLG